MTSKAEELLRLIKGIDNKSIKPPDNVDSKADDQTQMGVDNADKEEENHRITAIADKNTQNKEEHQTRLIFANRLFNLVVCWICGIGILVLWSGANTSPYHFYFRLSDELLITIVTSTSVTVIGLFVFVLKYLFKK